MQYSISYFSSFFFFFQAEDGIRDGTVTGVQTCALPISSYLFAVLGASTTCRGCLCRDRVRSYPSDLTDAQWRILRPQAQQVMNQLRWAKIGRASCRERV